jgi:flagellar biosynthetic protein FliR
MSPQPLTLDVAVLAGWVQRLWWPVLRISGFVAAAPLYSQGVVPRLVKIALTVGLAFLLAPLARVPDGLTILSAPGFAAAARELLVGVAIGTVVQVSFEALSLAGQTISMTMGLGFATLVDPLRGANTTVVGQLFTLLGLLTWLSLGGHVMLLGILAASFQSLPIGAEALGSGFLETVATWGGHVFQAGLLIALPAVIALLIINMALGVVTRAAPQLNLFGIGFPLTLLAGFTVLILGIDALLANTAGLIGESLGAVSAMLSPNPSAVP